MDKQKLLLAALIAFLAVPTILTPKQLALGKNEPFTLTASPATK